MSEANQESKRLFVAFVIPNSVNLSAVCDNLAKQIDGLLEQFELTFEKSPDFHCTLEFIGEMAAHKMELVKDGLSRAAIDYVTHVHAGPIKGLTINPGAQFMGENNALSMSLQIPEEIHTLVKYIRKHLNALDLPISGHKEFHAHVTLGRIPKKVLENYTLKTQIEEFAAQVPAPAGARAQEGESFEIKEFYLFHSSERVYTQVAQYAF